MRPNVQSLSAYSEAVGPDGINLSNNTNLFGVNPAIAKGVSRARVESFWDYPSLTSVDFRRALSKATGVTEEMVVTGNGSNDLIDVVVRTVTDAEDPVAYHPPTFSMIPFFVRLHGARGVPVPLTPEHQLDVDGILAENPKLTFVCRPNNPTGNAFPRRDVERIVRESRGLVVVDEAYVEFTDEPSFLDDVARHENLIVLRTLSKAHGLAALRVGYAVAPPDLAREISKVRGPFRLNAFSETVGGIAVTETEWTRGVAAAVKAERPRLAGVLTRHGFRVHPSDANFLFTEPPVDARALARALARCGVHVRDFGGDLARYLRITVGPSEITDRVEAALPGALAEAREGGAA